MAKKYSRVVKVDGKRFRYNYTDCEVEYIYRENGVDEVIDSIGLSKASWDDKDLRSNYLEDYAYQLDCEAEELMREAAWEFGF